MAARQFRNTGHIVRSEEHTSELQSLRHLVCRLLLEKKKGIGGWVAPPPYQQHSSSAARTTPPRWGALKGCASILRPQSGPRALSARKFFFFNDAAPTEIYTLPLHDALPICDEPAVRLGQRQQVEQHPERVHRAVHGRSEEHTSELQSRSDLVCRLLLEK